MSGDRAGRPSRAAIELARLLSCPGLPAADPAAGWAAILQVAAIHQLLPALWSALHHRGVRPLPDALAQRATSPLALLERAHEENAERTRDLRMHTNHVLDTLDAVGISGVALKGAHWLLTDALVDPAARSTVDVDILVAEALAAEASAALARVGYETVTDVHAAPHQLLPLVLAGWSGSVELHVAPLVAAHECIVDAEEIRARAEEITVAGVTRMVPDPTHMAVLLIAHAQLQDEGTRMLQLPLRALADLSNLTEAALLRVDWGEVQERFERGGVERSTALAGFATAADALFSIDLPVRRRGGGAWLQAVLWSMDHPSAAAVHRQVAYLPIALRRSRMHDLYAVDNGAALQRARLRHVGGGALARLTGRRRRAG